MGKPQQANKPKIPKEKKPKENTVECEAVVIESLPNAKFKVKLNEIDSIAIVTPSGRMRTHNIKILKGDNVKIELSTYDLTKGRITFRNRRTPNLSTDNDQNDNEKD